VGADDVICPPPVIKAFRELVPGSEYVEVPGAGHSVYFEAAGAFNEAVGAFLARHGGA
jgi:pimeloyl-ACP methyl ester carboxylesterase